jgi:hypothetical protein
MMKNTHRLLLQASMIRQSPVQIFVHLRKKLVLMKTRTKHASKLCLILAAAACFCQQCAPGNDPTYDRLKAYADEIKVINTHEHQHWPEEFGDHAFGLFHLVSTAYLMSDIVSAGGEYLDMEQLDSLSLEEYWELNGQALDYSRSTSYYSHFIRGFQKLYGFRDPYFTETNIHELSARVEENYSDYRRWFDSAFQKAGFELMVLDQYWKPFNTEVAGEYFALVFHINPLVMQATDRPSVGEESRGIYREAEREGFVLSTFDQYLDYCTRLFEKNVASHAVCIKNSMAYSRSLDYEEVPFEEAKSLYEKPSADRKPGEAKKIQDYVFQWIIQKSVEYGLPIQIHTGYLAGNGNWLENGRPEKLNNLFLKYPGAKFVLFHGGYPWTGEYAALGKMFPNVYLDIVWLPQISREEAVHALDEMFDGVPYNKFFWGGDCAFIEESAGSLEFGKEVVAEVLSKRIERGLLTEDVAEEMIRRIFRENAIETFQLEKRLGRSF